MQSLHIVYASTSGHTEFVIDTLVSFLLEKEKSMSIIKQRAEETGPEDLMKGDVLLLASGTWNTGSVEGQLNPHMHALLKDRAKDMDLRGKNCAIIALGDERYFYTARAGEHLTVFIENHNGKKLLPLLRIVNEPYGQEKRVQHFAEELLKHMKSLSSAASIE